jgi:hypothetical protein
MAGKELRHISAVLLNISFSLAELTRLRSKCRVGICTQTDRQFGVDGAGARVLVPPVGRLARLDTNRTTQHVSDQLLPSPRLNNLFCSLNGLCSGLKRYKPFPPKTLRFAFSFISVTHTKILRQLMAH